MHAQRQRRGLTVVHCRMPCVTSSLLPVLWCRPCVYAILTYSRASAQCERHGDMQACCRPLSTGDQRAMKYDTTRRKTAHNKQDTPHTTRQCRCDCATRRAPTGQRQALKLTDLRRGRCAEQRGLSACTTSSMGIPSSACSSAYGIRHGIPHSRVSPTAQDLMRQDINT